MSQSTSRPRSAFIVFEGLDGSGKSTLIEKISAELKRRSLSYVLTREPGGTPLAEDVRKLLLRTDGEAPVAQTELLLYSASRAQHVAKVIRPALERGEWVLCDRFSASTIAFQCFARGLPREQTEWLNRFAENGTHPDLYVLLDLTVAESRRRQEGRTLGSGQVSDRMERESLKFHESVREGFLTQAKENPQGWLVLDATQSPEQLISLLLDHLEAAGWLAS